MLDQVKRITRQTAVYGLGNVLNKLLGFLLIPLYNNFIPIGRFGDLAVLETTILLFTSILHFGIFSGHQRYFFIEKEKGTYGRFLLSNYAGNLLLTMISLLPLLLLSGQISGLLFRSIDNAGLLRIAFWIVFAEILCVVPLQILQYEEKPFQYLFYNFIKLALSFTLTIIFVRYYSAGIDGILKARLAGAAATAGTFMLLVVIPRISGFFSFRDLWISVRFGFPAILGNLGFLIFQLNDRYMLNWLSTDAETGKYAFGYKIANFINLIFISTIGLSYMPSMFSREKEENNLRYYRKMLTYYCFVIAFIILGFLFFYRELMALVARNRDYQEGLAVVPVLAMSFMIMGMNYFVGVGLYLKEKMIFFLIPSFTAAGLNVLLNFIMIPGMGMMGAAWSNLAAQACYTGLLAFIASRFMKISFEWMKIAMIYFLAVILFLAENLTLSLPFIAALLIRVALLGLFPLVLYKLNFFEKIEIQRIREGVSSVFNRFSPW